MKQIIFIASALCLAAIVGAVIYFLMGSDNKKLSQVHQAIQHQFPEVDHIDTQTLITMAPEDVILFDVREQAEFRVSHLKNAVRVDPTISAEEFVQTFAAQSKGKKAVFYCSVGQRSSDLANRAAQPLLSSGAKAVYNLENGIFGWHNEGRDIVQSDGAVTRYVHGYDRLWGRLVKDQKHTRY